MDWLSFISKIWDAAGNFAWPAAFVTGLVIFRVEWREWANGGRTKVTT